MDMDEDAGFGAAPSQLWQILDLEDHTKTRPMVDICLVPWSLVTERAKRLGEDEKFRDKGGDCHTAVLRLLRMFPQLENRRFQRRFVRAWLLFHVTDKPTTTPSFQKLCELTALHLWSGMTWADTVSTWMFCVDYARNYESIYKARRKARRHARASSSSSSSSSSGGKKSKKKSDKKKRKKSKKKRRRRSSSSSSSASLLSTSSSSSSSSPARGRRRKQRKQQSGGGRGSAAAARGGPHPARA